ncbi:hypothetical protein GH714_024407 [Hevea brasiliensis]|uniref:Bet v I/Major latex protein domain-containing protein n=1 Tax=Hevea brasiliensis TaxID=3981 RepID=A0A6A6MUU1_HEVBR|nr:hypothetical protein GH714_024407 [Hevea brasiliensis]
MMERDFLGLGSKSVPVTVKEEVTDGYKDSVPMRGSALQCSFSKKVSAIPQFLSFKSDSNQKPYSSMVQKNMALDRQGANHYAMTAYAVQHVDAYPVHRPQQMRIFPVINHQNPTITVSMSNPNLQSHFASTGNNVGGNSINSQYLAGVPIVSPVSVHPTPSSVVGTTDLRNRSKSSGAPAQLTIFYAGSVVFMRIFLLRRLRPLCCWLDMGLHLPSPISVTSSSAIELTTVKSVGALASANNQIETSKTVSSAAPGSAIPIPAGAVPQARKASLARFLEKRKERVMNTSPYNVSKKSLDCSAAECDDVYLIRSYTTSAILSPSSGLHSLQTLAAIIWYPLALYAILTTKWIIRDVPTIDSNLKYKGVRIPVRMAAKCEFGVEVFSSETGQLTDSVLSSPKPIYWSTQLTNAIVYNGLLHWLTRGNEILVYDIYSNGVVLLMDKKEGIPDPCYDCIALDCNKWSLKCQVNLTLQHSILRGRQRLNPSHWFCGHVTAIHPYDPNILYTGSELSHVKERIDAIDKKKLTYDYSVIGSDPALMNKALDKISFRIEVESCPDGGSIFKRSSKSYATDGAEVNEEEIKAGQEKAMEAFVGISRAFEAYILANPDAYYFI